MQQAQLKVVSRTIGAKSGVRKLRSEGLVPANIYSPGKKNAYCAFSERELRKIYNNDFDTNLVLTLETDTADLKGKKVIVKSLERDPVSWGLVHADLYEVSFDKALTVSLPLHFKGTAKGVKEDGGIFQVIRRTIRVRGLLADLPQFIEVDISELGLGESIHISECEFSDKLKVLDSGEFTLAAVVEAEKEEVAAPVATAEGAAAAAGTGAAAAGGTAAAPAAGAAAPAAGAKPADAKADAAKKK